MPFRTWIIAAAFGLIAALGQAQEPGDRPNGQAGNNQEPAQALPLPFPVEIVEDQPTTDARQRSEAEARQREIDDLAAQEGMNAATQAMNEATQRMADDSRQMTIATWVGVALLFLTLVLTIQANRAAVKAVKITERVGNEQLRAYVDQFSIVGMPTGHDQNRPDYTDSFTFQVIFTNNGQTPASLCIINAKISQIDIAASLPSSIPKRENDPTGFPGSRIGPGNNASAIVGVVPIENIERAARGEISLIFQCRIDYVDFNERQRFTETCSRLRVMVPVEDLTKKPFDPGFSFRFANVGENNRGT